MSTVFVSELTRMVDAARRHGVQVADVAAWMVPVEVLERAHACAVADDSLFARGFRAGLTGSSTDGAA
jgi:hypothetical protein